MGILINIRRLVGDRSASVADPEALQDAPVEEGDAFARFVADSLDELPDEFLQALEHVPVLIGDDGASRDLYGLYHGAGVAHPDVSAQIVVYRDTLLRDFGDDPARLADEIRHTVRHELAHHLGYGEHGVAGLGL